MAYRLSPFTGEVAKQLRRVDLVGVRKELERREKNRAAALRDAAGSKNAWYETSYPIFTALGPPTCRGDFVKRIAFAYSWLATIPKAEPADGHFKAVKDAVGGVLKEDSLSDGLEDPDDLMQRRWKVRKELTEIVQEALHMKTGHSVVAVSKVLHFWQPELAPMIDGNVSEGLKALPAHLRDGFIDNLTGDVRMSRYLWYWELAFRMRGDQSIDYRRLDQLLFLLGQQARA